MRKKQNGLVESTVKFEKLGLGLKSTLGKLTKNQTTTLLAINTTEGPLHIRQDSPVSTFEFITPEQARYLIPLEPKIFQSSDSNRTIKQIEKSIERTAKGKINQKTIKHENGFCFPAPETNPDISKMSAVEKRIYDELVKFENLEAIQPLSKNEDRKTFPNSIKWSDSVLSDKDKERTEHILVEFNVIFTRHRFDIGYTVKFSVKLAPDTNRLVYSKTQNFNPSQRRFAC